MVEDENLDLSPAARSASRDSPAAYCSSGKGYPDHVRVKGSADDDDARLRRYVYPIVGDVPLAAFPMEHAEDVMRRLPPKLRPATRRQVAQTMSRVLSLAVYPAKVLNVSPLPKGFLPKVGPRKAFSFLCPTEDAALLAEAKTPLVRRMLFGMLAREGLRASEGTGLEWTDVDLGVGVVNLDTNKTDDPRAWALDPGVRVALKRWRDLRPESVYVFESDDRGPYGERQPISVDKLAGKTCGRRSCAPASSAQSFSSRARPGDNSARTTSAQRS